MSENKYGEPWYWEIDTQFRQVHLFADRRNLVMDFVRYGMHGAQPRFNASGIMYPASDFVVKDANKTISQPIANRIVDCVNLCAGLSDDECKAMRSLWEKREEIRGVLRDALKQYDDADSPRDAIRAALSLIGGSDETK